mmetsp:Transcript_4502/g.5326  ORF Transcript_4502/g.5326 Transcript_4502/m.5326 type:complete len:667 (-) Transcript_4502:674-2674(-)
MDHEDLTASHWDDVISPHSEYTYNATSSSIPPLLNNQFNELSVDDSEDHEVDDEENNEEEDEEGNPRTPRYGYSNPVDEQKDELEKDERNDHKHKLLSELTHGAEEDQLESLMRSPENIKPSESLFNEKDSPIKPSTSVSNNQQVSPKRVASLKTSKYKPTRLRKFSSKTVVQHLGNENNTKESLGPLGEPTEAVSDKEHATSNGNDESQNNNNNKDLLVQQLDAPLYDIDNGTKNEPRKLDQSGHKSSSNDDSNVANTVNVRSSLEISVGDPMKVGDITNAHIVYSIKTKNKKPDSQLFPQGSDTFIVSRRYKDFRWIYHQLQNNHPGKIIPPPPTKQTYIGRFNENFIENRRLSLEKMLNKISHSPSLQEDPDFIMFLVSEDFSNESKEREKLSGSGASLQNDEFLDNESNSSNTDPSNPITVGSNAGGFMSSIFSMSQKIEEPDEYFTQKKEYIESLEHNLRVFYKSIELINTQRQEMAGLVDEISLTIDELASLEILKVTSDLLNAFSDVQLKLKENLDRINLQDQLTLGFTIEEYLRIIGSIKYVFESRSKIYQQYYNFNQEYIKKQAQLNKLNKKFKVQGDKASNLNFEVDKLKAKVQTFEKKFNLISETIKLELERFEFEKIDDFRNSVEIFIESSIESQKEAIELWETFYERENLSKI